MLKFRLIENRMADAVILKYYMVTVFRFLLLLPGNTFCIFQTHLGCVGK